MRCSTLLIFLIVCCTAGMMVNFYPLYLGDDQEEIINTKGGLRPWAAWWCHSYWILGLAQNSSHWFSKALTDYLPNYEGMKTEEGLPVWLEPTVIGLFLYIFLVFCCLWIFCRKRKQGDAQGYSRLPSGVEEKERESGVFLERRITVLEQQITQLRDDNKRITMVEQQIKELIDNKRSINQGEGDVKRRDKEDERISKLEQQVKELCDDKYIQTVRCSMTGILFCFEQI
nr:PREDICTED: uncharacterized protein LOC107077230 isoform X2 [Lepisosteus oculatus]